METYDPKLVCFSCKFGWGFLNGHLVPSTVIRNWIPVTCSGKIETSHILKAFRSGADGVLILGCPEGHCHFQDGNYQTRKKVLLIKKIMDAFGIEPERLGINLALDPDGQKIPRLIQEMKTSLVRLGPVKKI
ncbi:MAG: hydrogenase iron-sulfur subunit [Thermodesulfobacteriota bacterium]|nr:hydrogenase iron-sulfur subunit [Thermodesulfobacteriota bacterium]